MSDNVEKKLGTGWFVIAAIVLAFAVGGCDKKSSDGSMTALETPLGSDRLFSVESVARGARLYQENCALCHGPEAQGHPDWENPQVIAAPPLNGTGHESKHTKAELIATIKNGSKRNNEMVMPAWNGRLSDSEIEDILAWCQALWPMDVYDSWLKVDAGKATPDNPTSKPKKKS